MAKKPSCDRWARRVRNSRRDVSIHKWPYAKFLKILLFIFFLSCTVDSVTGAELDESPAESATVAPPDVFFAVQLLNRDLEFLRQHMGVPKASILDIRVYNAASHDVYFQGLTLFQKANRLSFEITRMSEQSPSLPNEIILPADVLMLVKGAHRSIRMVMDDLKVHVSPVKLIRDETKSPTDVFKKILATNRQLNKLLERRFSPSDVYKQVTLAIGYADRQLAQYPGATRIPDEPPFERGKKPSDVYFRLLEFLNIISNTYKAAGLKALEIDKTHIDDKSITPSDVFDVASLIVARLDFLHKNFALSKMPIEAFYPGLKYPSDVYQQAGILKEQLRQLEHFITTRGLPK